jgi:glutathione S-transferase
MMTRFVLYNAPQSTCSQRARFVLHAKSQSFEDVRLDLFSGDQLKPEYLAINPNGVVPSLLDEGRAVLDSAVIIEYLDEILPAPPLVPRDTFQRAAMRSLMRFIDEVPTPAIRVPSYNLAFLQHYRGMSDAEFQALADSKPLRRDFLLSMGRTGFPEAEMRRSRQRLAQGVARLQGAIEGSGGPFMLGAEMSLADVALMPTLVRMWDLGMEGAWDGLPLVARWFELIRAHPAYAATYYHGTLLTEKYPELNLRHAGRDLPPL